MKNIYINTKLAPLLIDTNVFTRLRGWIFSQGMAWLLLTPRRLQRLAERLGLEDDRISLLVRLARRYSCSPERYCRALGIEETRYYEPEDYPFALCPCCDNVYYPHPEDTSELCEDCQREVEADARRRQTPLRKRERRGDKLARQRLWNADPSQFHQGELSPNYKLNLHRRVYRDWDAAMSQILLGRTYKQVAREFDCSVGLLHKRVQERYWENN